RHIGRLVGRLRGADIDHIVFYQSHSEVPSVLGKRTLAVVGKHDYWKWAIFLCPCGRGHRIDVNLQRHHDPHWTISLGAWGPTLAPSVDYRGDFRCHFYL